LLACWPPCPRGRGPHLQGRPSRSFRRRCRRRRGRGEPDHRASVAAVRYRGGGFAGGQPGGGAGTVRVGGGPQRVREVHPAERGGGAGGPKSGRGTHGAGSMERPGDPHRLGLGGGVGLRVPARHAPPVVYPAPERGAGATDPGGRPGGAGPTRKGAGAHGGAFGVRAGFPASAVGGACGSGHSCCAPWRTSRR